MFYDILLLNYSFIAFKFIFTYWSCSYLGISSSSFNYFIMLRVWEFCQREWMHVWVMFWKAWSYWLMISLSCQSCIVNGCSYLARPLREFPRCWRHFSTRLAALVWAVPLPVGSGHTAVSIGWVAEVSIATQSLCRFSSREWCVRAARPAQYSPPDPCVCLLERAWVDVSIRWVSQLFRVFIKP